MRPETEALLILQTRDSKIQRLKIELLDIPKAEAKANEKLSNDLTAVESAKKDLQENAIAMKNLELDIDTRKTTIGRLKQQQFETRKNDEYTALGNEIVRYSGEVDELETQQLELMEKADGLSAIVQEAESGLAQTQSIVDEDLKTLAAKKQNLEKELSERLEERPTFVANVNESDLSLYIRLAKQKDGVAMAEVSSTGQCLGCNIKLVAATIVKLRAEKETVLCENCSRILYEV